MVHFEELSRNLTGVVDEMLSFLRLGRHPGTDRFLELRRHPLAAEVAAEPWDTFRNSSEMARRWLRGGLDWDEVEEVQRRCAVAMDMWGYRRIAKEEWESDKNTMR